MMTTKATQVSTNEMKANPGTTAGIATTVGRSGKTTGTKALTGTTTEGFENFA